MPFFEATVRTSAGKRERVKRIAATQREATSSLRDEGYVILSVKELSEDGAASGSLPPPWHPSWLKPMGPFDIEIGFRQLASMLKSGVSILVALETVANQAMSPRASKVWFNLYEMVSSGISLSSALSKCNGIFSAVTIELVKVGEQAGELDSSLLHASRQLESQRNLRSMVVNALTYPIFAVVMALSVSVFLVVSVIPKIGDFLQSGGASLPAITQLLLDISEWIRINGLLLIIFAVAFLAFIAVLKMTSSGRLLLSTVLLRFPVVGNIQRLSGTASFARAMEMLVQSGVTLVEALDVVRPLLSNARLSLCVRDAYEAVIRGETLASVLRKPGAFTPMLGQMVAVGETSGSLPEAFGEVARFHESMLKVTIRRFSVTIEPIMIIITGLIVGFVYLAFFLALFSMASAG
jgi:type IV pilus assembly protein PilC